MDPIGNDMFNPDPVSIPIQPMPQPIPQPIQPQLPFQPPQIPQQPINPVIPPMVIPPVVSPPSQNQFFGQNPFNPRTDMQMGDHLCRCVSGFLNKQTLTCGTNNNGIQSIGGCGRCPPGSKCIRDYKAAGGRRCSCAKYARYNYETYKCDCKFQTHGPYCECKNTQWYDKRYRMCRSVTKAVFRNCQFNMNCKKVRNSYCQALGPREAGCVCASGYMLKKIIPPVHTLELASEHPNPRPNPSRHKCIRDFQNTTIFVREQEDPNWRRRDFPLYNSYNGEQVVN